MIGLLRFWIGLTALVGATGPVAAAETLQQKICVLGAAERAPAIRGLSIEDVALSDLTADQAAARVVRSYGNVLRASDELTRRFGIGDPRVDVQIKRADALGDRAAAEAALAEALAARITGKAAVEMTIKALNRDAVLAFTCVWSPDGGVLLVANGITR